VRSFTCPLCAYGTDAAAEAIADMRTCFDRTDPRQRTLYKMMQHWKAHGDDAYHTCKPCVVDVAKREALAKKRIDRQHIRLLREHHQRQQMHFPQFYVVSPAVFHPLE
jgi:hypothetical protein